MTQRDERRFRKELRLHMEFLWSFIVRARAGFRCELHGKDHVACSVDNRQAAHLVTRGVPHLKFDLRNGRSLCAAHHKYYTHRPEFWSAIATATWIEDWCALTRSKWAGVEKRELLESFAELFETAIPFLQHHAEYLPRFEKLSRWQAEHERFFGQKVGIAHLQQQEEDA